MSNLTRLSFAKTHKSDARIFKALLVVSHNAAVHLGTCLPLFREDFERSRNRKLDAGQASFKLP